MCIGCHNIPGYQASFPEIYKVPKIAGQNAKYIVASLNAYKKGERKHPSMRAIATTLSDQDAADVAAYYEQLEKSAARPGRAGRGAGRHRQAAGQGQLRVLPRQELQRADRPELSQARRPVRRLPLRRAQGLPDRSQPARRPQQRDHDGHGPAVHPRRDQVDGQVPLVAARRAEDRPAARVPLMPRGPAAAPAAAAGSFPGGGAVNVTVVHPPDNCFDVAWLTIGSSTRSGEGTMALMTTLGLTPTVNLPMRSPPTAGRTRRPRRRRRSPISTRR